MADDKQVAGESEYIMKILILNGSPKGERSATLKLARAFADGVRREGDVLDLIDISKSDVHGCRGCFGCWANRRNSGPAGKRCGHSGS